MKMIATVFASKPDLLAGLDGLRIQKHGSGNPVD
jgi:hypothetical protein